MDEPDFGLRGFASMRDILLPYICLTSRRLRYVRGNKTLGKGRSGLKLALDESEKVE